MVHVGVSFLFLKTKIKTLFGLPFYFRGKRKTGLSRLT